MDIYSKLPVQTGRKTLIFLVLGIFLLGMPIFELVSRENTSNLNLEEVPIILNNGNLSLIERNSLVGSKNPSDPEPKVVQKLSVIVTAYSSTSWETDDDPFVTAAGTWVRDGIIANNYLPFGTKVRIPEIYGDKVFVVEDRMNWKKGNYHIDIWFPSYWEAKNFGAKRTYIVGLEG